MSSVCGAGQPVIVGVDGSKSALDAVRWAVREAELRGVTLRLVHAFGWMSVADPDDYPELELRKALLTEAQEWLADAARLVPPGVEVVSEVLDDFPIPRLVTESRNAPRRRRLRRVSTRLGPKRSWRRRLPRSPPVTG